MRIYTKYGDGGATRLYGGVRVSKSDPRVEAYGTMDELNSLLGLVIALVREQGGFPSLIEEGSLIQQELFDCGSDLATANQSRPYKQLPHSEIWLEEKIDDYLAQTPSVQQFVLPGGHILSAYYHQLRTLTRRLERRIVALMEIDSDINRVNLHYVNRLSDYFFVVARYLNHKLGEADQLYERSPSVFKNKKRGS
ncbi:cob(I)yrinic acid a,c-diamide adenosyltransferase [Streptococcus danieliae]|uniref:Corrinoid adenosyltransferase n=1 Tax=Streptococcus danieliae TaxID=747656 RepID=A0A7Z0M4B7_9STRE|nr:cob(I)yrinic acid a,c-diamide adenosyltransferase [Streptococcus danieliae]MBF0698457.1 cob(I)yrinic acid a,c-diamide adenosyltransferase [Streptococcus danieliae]MVX58088.1 cob(I)yrinic acid a,c-diamide adenosyltransferase [Streptococcus danieliae]NYS95634.1 cob(I)yrinic acid a,c-diamide adenosyltransferase [Streptococcus danieliae]